MIDDARPLRNFHQDPELIRHLLEIGDITGVVQNGELFIRLSEIEPFMAGGEEPLDRSASCQLPAKGHLPKLTRAVVLILQGQCLSTSLPTPPGLLPIPLTCLRDFGPLIT